MLPLFPLSLAREDDQGSAVVRIASCTPFEMRIVVSLANSSSSSGSNALDPEKTQVYLEKLRDYPSCRASFDAERQEYSWRLPLDDTSFFKCGTSRLSDRRTGTRAYYHRVIVETRVPSDDSALTESEEQEWQQEVVTVKCVVRRPLVITRRRRQSGDLVIEEPDLPSNFSEASEELIDWSGSVTGRAPMPLLSMGIRRKGEYLDTGLVVSPGTPLELLISLDESSSRVYGILANLLRVTDDSTSSTTAAAGVARQEEVIVLNGCSVDPYIFSDFDRLPDGSLSAHFRAFKFPDSHYVLFLGSVNVCLRSCAPSQCGPDSRQQGFGRRRRESPSTPPDRIFEAQLSVFVKVSDRPVLLSSDDDASSKEEGESQALRSRGSMATIDSIVRLLSILVTLLYLPDPFS